MCPPVQSRNADARAAVRALTDDAGADDSRECACACVSVCAYIYVRVCVCVCFVARRPKTLVQCFWFKANS